MINIKSRKGMGFLSDLIGYFMVFLIVIVFWIIAGLITRNISNQINQEAAVDLIATDFLMMLREPTNSGDSVSEMIIKSEFNTAKKNDVAAFITTRFTGQYKDRWHIDITYPEGKPLSLGYSSTKTQSSLGGAGAVVSSAFNTVYLPSMGGGDIVVELENWDVTYLSIMKAKP